MAATPTTSRVAADDPRVQPGAFVTFGSDLYEVQRYDPTTGALCVVDASADINPTRPDEELWLSAHQATRCRFIRAGAPPETDVKEPTPA